MTYFVLSLNIYFSFLTTAKSSGYSVRNALISGFLSSLKCQETITRRNVTKIFIMEQTVLNSLQVSAFSTWEKELHKIVFDPRYLLLNSEERKQASCVFCVNGSCVTFHKKVLFFFLNVCSCLQQDLHLCFITIGHLTCIMNCCDFALINLAYVP